MEDKEFKRKIKETIINSIDKKEDILMMINSTLDELNKMSYSNNIEIIESLCDTYVLESKKATQLGIDVTNYDNKYSGLREIILNPELVN